MKTSEIIIFFLLLFATTLFANNKPLRYNLNVGDEYFYKYSSEYITLVPYRQGFSFHYQFKLEVLSKTKEEYKLGIIFWEMREEDPLRQSITSQYSIPKYNNRSLAQQLIGKRIEFTLTALGEVKGLIESLSNIIDNELDNVEILGILNRLHKYSRSVTNSYNLNKIIQSIFIKFPATSEKKWTIMTPSIGFRPVIPVNYSISGNNLENIQFSYNTELLTDTVIINSDYQRTFWKEITSGIISAEANSLLPIRGSKKVKMYQTNRYRENVKEVWNENELRQHQDYTFEKVEPNEFVSTVIISGEIETGSQVDSIRFYVSDNFLDNEIFNHTVQVSNDGKFHLKTSLPRVMEITSSLNNNLSIAYYNNLLLEPGDSIYLKILKNNSIEFSGKGSYKTILSNKIREMGKSIHRELYSDKALKLFNNNHKKKIETIEESDEKLSDWAKQHLKTSAYFSELNKLKTYYKFKSQGDNIKLYKKLFDDIDFENYTTSTSYDFRTFINKHNFKPLLNLDEKRRYNTLTPTENYMLSKILLNREIEYYVLANIVSEGLKRAEISEYKLIYEDYQKLYPGTEFANTLSHTYENRDDLSNGETAPNFTLKSLDNKNVSLNDFKEKWVMLSFCDVNSNSFQEDILELQKMVERLPKESFKLILAFSQNDKTETEKFLQENKIEAVFLDNHGWKYQEVKKYKIEDSGRNFLISPKGKIEFSGTISGDENQYIIGSMINSINYKIKNDKQEALVPREALFGLLGGFILLIVLFFGIYKWRISIVKKREQQQREKLKLEMQAVRSQLNPHFLFNSMNSIQHLVNADENEKANLFLSKFGVLMRKVLNQSELKLIPIKDELETLETYLELEALRHNFTYAINIDENIDQFTTELPPMLLQPFVENAVVHGINGMKSNGEIIINLHKKETNIIIQIIDNGKGLVESSDLSKSNGKGLQITQKRVQLMMENYKNEITFSVRNQNETEPTKTGTIAEITFEQEN